MMTLIGCLAGYFFLVWLFLRFFGFVAEKDREIELMKRKIQDGINERR